MARKQVVVCDVCERVDRKTKTYRVTSEGRRYTIELCAEHRRPLEALLDKTEGRPVRRPVRFEDAVTTMEELERRKAARSTDTKNTPAASE